LDRYDEQKIALRTVDSSLNVGLDFPTIEENKIISQLIEVLSPFKEVTVCI
jgi:hypothetical protein